MKLFGTRGGGGIVGMAMDYKQALLDIARPYWAAEAEIPRRFVAAEPSREDYITYLKTAIYKELNPVIGYPPPDGYANGLHMELSQLIARFPEIGSGADRHEYYARLETMVEEFNHYLVLADVLEFALGRPLTGEDAQQLPEDKKLNDMRRRYMDSGDPCLRAAMGLTEGGGSRTFEVLAGLSGGPLEDKLAAAMKVIYSDEKNHYEAAGEVAVGVITSEDDFTRMAEALREVSLQRVKMRYEQFAEPLPWAEVLAMIDGSSPA